MRDDRGKEFQEGHELPRKDDTVTIKAKVRSFTGTKEGLCALEIVALDYSSHTASYIKQATIIRLPLEDIVALVDRPVTDKEIIDELKKTINEQVDEIAELKSRNENLEANYANLYNSTRTR